MSSNVMRTNAQHDTALTGSVAVPESVLYIKKEPHSRQTIERSAVSILVMSSESDYLSRQKAVIFEISRALQDATAEAMRSDDIALVVGTKHALREAVSRLKETTG